MAIKFLSGLNLSNVTAGSILKLDSNGNIVAAVDGTDYNTSSSLWSTAGTGGVNINKDVRIGTFSSDVLPEARLHVYAYQTTDPKLLIEDGNTGDASMEFKISTQSYTMGIDNSDSDKFVLAASTALGTTNVLEISTTGLAAFQKQVLFNEPVSVLGTYGHWRVNGYGGMYFNNNSDTNNTRYIHPRSDGALSIGRGLTSALTGSAPDSYFTTTYDQLYIKSDGNVGIGTTSPDFKLDVAGNIGMDGNLYHNGDHNTYIGFGGDTQTFRTGGTDRMTITNSGIGIGTASPAYNLDVSGSARITGNIWGTNRTSVLHNFVTDASYEGNAFYNPETFNAFAGADKWSTITITNAFTSNRTTSISALSAAVFQVGGNTWQPYFDASETDMVIEIDHTSEPLRYGGHIGIQWTNSGWSARNVKIEVYNGTSWTTIKDITGNTATTVVASHSAGSAGVQKTKFTLGDPNNSSGGYMRISKIFGTDYKGDSSYDVARSGTYYLEKFVDNQHYSNIYPAVDSTYTLGTSTYHYSGVYTDTLYSPTIRVSGTNDHLTLRSDIQVDQGSTDPIIEFKYGTTQMGKFDQDGYMYATGFKTTTASTGLLKADGTVDTTTLGTMASESASDYKDSDAVETYVGLELASYTLTSAFGSNAFTSYTDHSTQNYLTSYTETDTLDSVTGRGATTTNNISIGNLTAVGGAFTDPVTIYDSLASENPRLSVGRNAGESIQFDVTDVVNTITAKQDSDSDGDHTFVLDRVFAGAGDSIFTIQNDGTPDLTIDGSGVVSFNQYNTAGILKVNTSGTISVDTSSYLTSYTETSTLDNVADRGATTNQALTLGSSATSGGRILSANYTGSNRLGVISSEYSSGDLLLGYGAEGKNGSAGFVSTYGNFSGAHSVLQVASSSLDWRVDASNSQTEIGSDLTLASQFAVSRTGILTMGDGFTSTKGNTAHGWGNHASAGYLTTSTAATTYAPLASPALTGTPTAPTAAAATNTTQVATTAFVTTAVSNLVDSSPAALNTLNELAAALGDDASFSTTMSTALGNRLRIDVNNQSLSSTELANARTNLGLGTAATSAATDFVAVSGDTMTGTLRLPWKWHSTDIASNTFYVKGNSDQDGFAFGVGTGVSSWFSWDNTAGLKRAIDVWNNGSLIKLGEGGHDVEVKNDLYVPAHIFHTGDTDTYMQFHAGDQWRVVTGGTERLEVNNTNTTVANTLTASGGINGLTLANGGISGTNYNITGVNQLEIADPGEGIVFKSGASGDMVLAIVDDTADNILRFSGTNATFDVAGNLSSTSLTIADSIIHEGDTNTSISFGTDAINFNTGGGARAIINDSGAKFNNNTIIAGGSTLSLGERAEGDDNGRTVLIEGVANAASGEGSGRIFFSEHNSTTAAADSYGLSLYYEGDPNAQLPSGFQPNTGNATWSLRRHDNSVNGVAIMSGGRTSSDVTFSGSISATSKSFDIEHPTKEGKRLVYGSLEGAEHGVYFRGKGTGEVIELPEHWTGLVHEDSITVQLTPIGKNCVWVEDIKDNAIHVGMDNDTPYFYFIQAERKDIDKLIVEQDA